MSAAAVRPGGLFLVLALEELTHQVPDLTRMQLIRTCAAWRPNETALRDPRS
ncbi:hypothetical protein [Streptomyces sp. NPDC005017]|uniref:hypothetical protein n=1 Tax=Streptomyces sp. NPDC005017 TaxID=3364706 RepID=UPI00367C03A1